MRVVEIERQDQQKRYVVIDDTGRLVEPIVRYLKYLDRISSARQTLRSYAFDLKLYWEFLSQQALDWQHVTLDDLSRFILWLKLPSGSLKVLPPTPSLRRVPTELSTMHLRLYEAFTTIIGAWKKM